MNVPIEYIAIKEISARLMVAFDNYCLCRFDGIITTPCQHFPTIKVNVHVEEYSYRYDTCEFVKDLFCRIFVTTLWLYI